MVFRSQGYGNFFKLILLPTLVLLASCVRPAVEPRGPIQAGIASWYGPDFHGKPTSSREIYDMHDLTAAHRTLPFGTHVMVTNLENGRSVVVRINDRGPFVKGRIIDLSYAAARALDMIRAGTARVRIEVLSRYSPPLSSVSYAVQVGAFVERANALRLRDRLRASYGNVAVIPFRTASTTYYRVRIKARDRADAERIARRLAADGYPAILLEEQ